MEQLALPNELADRIEASFEGLQRTTNFDFHGEMYAESDVPWPTFFGPGIVVDLLAGDTPDQVLVQVSAMYCEERVARATSDIACIVRTAGRALLADEDPEQAAEIRETLGL